jgi:hypothetical protein
MANKAAGEMEIIIDSKSFTLRPSFMCIMDFEEKAGLSVFEAMRAVGEKQSVPMKSVAAAFHAGIKAAWKPTNGKLPTFEEIGMAIRKDGLTNHLESYMRFLANMMTGEHALENAEKGLAEGKA